MNRLSKSMRQQWMEQGYLHVKNAISREEAARCLEAANEVIERFEVEHPELREKGGYPIMQTLFRSTGFDGLMDHPNLFGIVLDLMVPYLQIMGSEIYVRYPEGKMSSIDG
jgi:hypothetical protein